MKKIILIMAFLSISLIADNAKCENLLAEIRNNSSQLESAYNSGNNVKVQQVMKKTFRIATQAMFTCEDERNLDDLENILNQIGTQLGI